MRKYQAILLGILMLILTGCAGVPTNSTPQVIRTIQQSSSASLSKPNPNMSPEMVLREFLKATADPTNRHLAARQFLTQQASAAWDDAGSAFLVGNVNFHTTGQGDRLMVTMSGDILGTLSDIGVFETAAGALPQKDPIELIHTDEGWKINHLANGVFLDWQQFQATYKRHTLYFVDPTGKTVVPDPRYIAVGDTNQLATELVLKLITGPRPELADAVRNLLSTPIRLRGPVTRADGGKDGVGRGYSGTRIDLDGVDANDPHSRQLLAAQLIWTLLRSDIQGPYFIDADGVAFDDRFVDGWNPSDVIAMDPGAYEGSGAGLHALVSGAIVGIDDDKIVHLPGAFGREVNQVASALSRDGRQAASVVVRPDQENANASLWVGDLGGEAIQVAEGHHLTRPSWAIDHAVWEVIDGTTVIRALEEGTTGRPAQIPVDSGEVFTKFPGKITELQLSRDGTRAAMLIDGQIVLASVGQNSLGQFFLGYPRRLGYGLGQSAVSLSWITGDDLIVSRNDLEHAVAYVNLDGVNSDTPMKGLTHPVGVIAASPTQVYIADPHGIFSLSLSTPKEEQQWKPVNAFHTPGVVPVLPG